VVDQRFHSGTAVHTRVGASIPLIQTIYTWRKRFGEMNAGELKRLRRLEVENARLKKIPAERDRAMRPLRTKGGGWVGQQTDKAQLACPSRYEVREALSG
jgi:hypothetical protein